MTTYIVTFQPANELERTRVREVLKGFPGYCPIHRYCWAIRSDKSAAEVRDTITKSVPSLKIFVIRSGVAAAWRGAPGEQNNEWLKKNL